VNLKRQAGPHAHSIQVTTDNRLALVADLGIDRLLVYDFDERTGTLTADSLKFRRLQPGSGPRHVAIAPSGKFVYVVNELTSSVTGFAYSSAQKSLAETQTLSTLPADFAGTNTTAEIIVDSQGKFLYVSNRGDDSIVVFSIGADGGKLTPVQRMPCGGKSPRNIALDPSGRWLFSANQRSDRVNVFRVDRTDGRLTATSRSVGVTSPVCVTFISQR
jgi:6-phosphogluconolactonase